MKRGSALLEVIQHPDNKLHYILVGDFLVLDWKWPKDFNLSPQDSKLVIVEWISWNVSRVKNVEVAAI